MQGGGRRGTSLPPPLSKIPPDGFPPLFEKSPVRGVLCNLTGLKVPPPIKKRGRPKGCNLTTIGLPAKKVKTGVTKKPCSFAMLHTSDKEKSKTTR